jgi:fructosamine-3-kinase
MDLTPITADIRKRHGVHLDHESARAVGGGCINRCWALAGDGARWFLKVNRRNRADMFDAEAAGLAVLKASATLRVPTVAGHGCAGDHAYLLLEWIELGASAAGAEAALGAGLARMHRVTARQFGFESDNFIGSTPQRNRWCDDWAEFFVEQRLGFQLDLADRNGLGGDLQKLGRELKESVPVLLAGHAPSPSLLHGDLWGGNWSCDEHGAPVIYDPAAYFGDREADLAMTRLFGGFGAEFYSAYEREWPLAAGADRRMDLYNLYHVLNHANLFGGGYAAQATAMMRRLLG